MSFKGTTIVAVRKNGVVLEDECVLAGFRVVQRMGENGVPVHFEVVEHTGGGHLAGTLVRCGRFDFFDGEVRTDERAYEIERDGAADLRSAFGRVVGAVAVDMLAMVIDGDIGVTRKGDNLFSL